MAESVVLIRAIKHDPYTDEMCKNEIFSDRYAYIQPVNDYQITNPQTPTLRSGFMALAASQNPILWIDHHGDKDNKNCRYEVSRICEPENMAKLIWQHAKGLSFRATLQIYQFSCYASRYHMQLLASELQRLGLRNFKVWGCPDKIHLWPKYPYFEVNFSNSRRPEFRDNFWRKKSDGRYAYADCIVVDSEGKMYKKESHYTRKTREHQQQQRMRQPITGPQSRPQRRIRRDN